MIITKSLNLALTDRGQDSHIWLDYCRLRGETRVETEPPIMFASKNHISGGVSDGTVDALSNAPPPFSEHRNSEQMLL